MAANGRVKRRRRSLVVAGATGAAIMYFFDPQNGRGRRVRFRDQGLAMFRRGGRRVGRAGRRTGAKAYGTWMKATHPVPHDLEPTDETLADKVRSEVLRGPDGLKGRIIVNVQEGVVVLRGEVDQPEQIQDIPEAVLRIPGVAGVENLLHLPGEAAPNKERALEASARAEADGRTGG